MDDKTVRKLLNINGLRTKLELNEQYCFDMIRKFKQKKTIASTRSFGEDVQGYEQISEAMYQYVLWAIKKLKDNNLSPNNALIFLTGNRHKENNHYNSKFITFHRQTRTVNEIWAQIEPHLKSIYDDDTILKNEYIFNPNENTYYIERKNYLYRTVWQYNKVEELNKNSKNFMARFIEIANMKGYKYVFHNDDKSEEDNVENIYK